MSKPIDINDYKGETGAGVNHIMDHAAYKAIIDMLKWSVAARQALTMVSACSVCNGCRDLAAESLEKFPGHSGPAR